MPKLVYAPAKLPPACEMEDGTPLNWVVSAPADRTFNFCNFVCLDKWLRAEVGKGAADDQVTCCG